MIGNKLSCTKLNSPQNSCSLNFVQWRKKMWNRNSIERLLSLKLISISHFLTFHNLSTRGHQSFCTHVSPNRKKILRTNSIDKNISCFKNRKVSGVPLEISHATPGLRISQVGNPCNRKFFLLSKSIFCSYFQIGISLR